jgi:hypothetical protein
MWGDKCRYLLGDATMVAPTMRMRAFGLALAALTGLLVSCASASDPTATTSPERPYVTVAGTGESGHTGDGAAAIGAALDIPLDIAIAPDGSLYISEAAAIRRVATNGQIETVVGTGIPPASLSVGGPSGDGGPAGQADASPAGVAVDPAGSVFFADFLHG